MWESEKHQSDLGCVCRYKVESPIPTAFSLLLHVADYCLAQLGIHLEMSIVCIHLSYVNIQ